MTSAPPRIAIFGGNLHAASLNVRLMRAIARTAGPLCDVETLAIRELPFYNQDLDPGMGGSGMPEPVARFRASLEAADGAVIVCPEYNWSIPGVLKNAIDWISQPSVDGPLAGTPTLLAGASLGPAASGRAQLHLRQSLLSIGVPALLVDLQVPFAATKIDDAGTLEPDLQVEVERLVGRIVAEAVRARDEGLALPVRSDSGNGTSPDTPARR